MIQAYKEKIQMAEAMLNGKDKGALIGLPEIMNLYVRLGEVEINYARKGLIKSVATFKPTLVGSGKLYRMLTGAGAGILILVVFLLIKSFVIYYRQDTTNKL
jgi:hypothetical protein